LRRIEVSEEEESRANVEKNEFARDLSLLYKALTTVGEETAGGEVTANKNLLHGFLTAKGVNAERENILLAAATNAGNIADEGTFWRLKKW
jgi:hypothetical protein